MGGGPVKRKLAASVEVSDRVTNLLGMCIREAERGASDYPPAKSKFIQPNATSWLRTTFRAPFLRKLINDPDAYYRDTDFLNTCSYLLGWIAARDSQNAAVTSDDLLAALDKIQRTTCGKRTGLKFIGVWCDIG